MESSNGATGIGSYDGPMAMVTQARRKVIDQMFMVQTGPAPQRAAAKLDIGTNDR